MRAILFAALMAAGIGLIGTSGAMAAPANGLVIDEAAGLNEMSLQVWYRRHYRRRCFHRRYVSRVRCWR